jgi:nucleoid DNA-binding protein
VLAKNKLKQEVIKEIQAELGGSMQEIESVVESQFDFIKQTMERGLFDSVRLPYFGRFKVNPYRLRRLNIAIATRNRKK